MASDSENVALCEGAKGALCVARSIPNQIVCFTLIVVAFLLHEFVELPLIGRFGAWTILFTIIILIQALRTYVVRTLFAFDRIEHRTMLGAWRSVEYSKILVLNEQGESITIIGEDVVGKSIRIVLRKWDGNFERVLHFLRQKTSSSPW